MESYLVSISLQLSKNRTRSFLKNWRNFSKQLLCLTPGNSYYGCVFLLNFDLVLEAVFWLYFKVAKHACILDCYHGSLYSE